MLSHSGVQSAAVIGVPDTDTNVAVHAIVVIDPEHSPTEAELIAHCKNLLPPSNCPRSISLQIEPLPMSAQGKIMKEELRKTYWKG